MHNIKVFLFLASVILISIASLNNLNQKQTEEQVPSQSSGSVQGMQESIEPSPSPSQTPTINTNSSTTKTSLQKQYGGWYWRPDLGYARRYMGTDNQGDEIWSDTNDPPPSAQNTSSNTSSSNSNSNLQSSSSSENSTTQQVSVSQTLVQNPTPVPTSGETKVGVVISVQSRTCSQDGSNPDIPRCD